MYIIYITYTFLASLPCLDKLTLTSQNNYWGQLTLATTQSELSSDVFSQFSRYSKMNLNKYE